MEDSMAHPNEELVRRGYQAFATGDVATLNELFADDIVWHAPGRNQLAGTYRGKEGSYSPRVEGYSRWSAATPKGRVTARIKPTGRATPVW
jgi:ketosteroid isomerase-like protein